MLTLFINTTGEKLEISIWQGLTCLSRDCFEEKMRLSEELLPRIKNLLQTKKLKPTNLNLIAVHPGPGSFTGARIGVTCANTLAWALDIPIVSATLETLPKLISKIYPPGFTQPVLPHYDRDPAVTIRLSKCRNQIPETNNVM